MSVTGGSDGGGKTFVSSWSCMLAMFLSCQTLPAWLGVLVRPRVLETNKVHCVVNDVITRGPGTRVHGCTGAPGCSGTFVEQPGKTVPTGVLLSEARDRRLGRWRRPGWSVGPLPVTGGKQAT